MKKIFTLLLVFSVLLSTEAFAQTKHKKMDTDKKVEKMSEELDLTAEQEEQVRNLYERKAERVDRKDRKQDKSSKEAHHAEKIRMDREMQRILTAEQYEKYHEMKKDKHNKMKREDKRKQKRRN